MTIKLLRNITHEGRLYLANTIVSHFSEEVAEALLAREHAEVPRVKSVAELEAEKAALDQQIAETKAAEEKRLAEEIAASEKKAAEEKTGKAGNEAAPTGNAGNTNAATEANAQSTAKAPDAPVA